MSSRFTAEKFKEKVLVSEFDMDIRVVEHGLDSLNLVVYCSLYGFKAQVEVEDTGIKNDPWFSADAKIIEGLNDYASSDEFDLYFDFIQQVNRLLKKIHRACRAMNSYM
jgi:hypothetical protein